MKYVDAGYIVAFGVLFLYSVSLLLRRRRLEGPRSRVDRDDR
jgi:hypothetical protein